MWTGVFAHQNSLGSNLGKILRIHPSVTSSPRIHTQEHAEEMVEKREKRERGERGDCGNGHVPDRKPGT